MGGMERLSPKTGRRIALTAVWLSIMVTSVGGYVGRHRLIEGWHIWRLYSHDEATRLAALEKLTEMRSRAALPHLIRIAHEMLCEEVPPSSPLWDACGPKGYRRVLDGAHDRHRLEPIFHAMSQIGQEAPGFLRRLALAEGEKVFLSDRRDREALELGWVLSRMAQVSEVRAGAP